MLKRKINADAYNALPDAIKAEYKVNGADYVLDTDDARELQTALNNEKEANKGLKTTIATLEEKVTNFERSNGDLRTLEDSYKQKLEAKDKELGEVRTALNNERTDRHVKSVAQEIAAKNFTVPSLMVDKIAARLHLDPADNKTVRVLDKDGKVSALTTADLTKEFVDNPEFKAIVVANRASGSAAKPGASGTNQGNTPYTPPKTPEGTDKRLADMSPAELAAHMKAKREAAAEGATT